MIEVLLILFGVSVLGWLLTFGSNNNMIKRENPCIGQKFRGTKIENDFIDGPRLSGITNLFLANYDDLVSYDLNIDGTVITGLTTSFSSIPVMTDHPIGSTEIFFEVTLNKQIGVDVNNLIINNKVNNVSVSKPNISGFVEDKFIDLILRFDVIGVVKTIDGKYYAVGFDNGLSFVSGSYDSTDGAKNRFQFELEGIESKSILELTVTNFESRYVIL